MVITQNFCMILLQSATLLYSLMVYKNTFNLIMDLTFNHSAVDRLVDISENLVISTSKHSLRDASLILLFEFWRFVRDHLLPSKTRLVLGIGCESGLSVCNWFVSIVNANDFIWLVNALGGSCTPAVKYGHFLGHVLSWFGTTEG